MDQSPSMLTEDLNALRSFPIFSGIPVEVTQLFAYLAERKQYRAGEPVIIMDREADRAFFLIHGQISISLKHQGQEMPLQTLEPGTIFGELALLAPFNWFCSARAAADCELMVLSRASFQKVLNTFPQHREKMIERIVQLRVQRQAEQTRNMLVKSIESKQDGREDTPSNHS